MRNIVRKIGITNIYLSNEILVGCNIFYNFYFQPMIYILFPVNFSRIIQTFRGIKVIIFSSSVSATIIVNAQ